jgi:DNA-binding CsgD family transcriptional regulator
MLLGRRQERGQIDALLAQARSGASGALLIVGEPGVGKSALLADAFARADGLSALWARGVESEIELAFSGLAQLLAPQLLGHLEAIPGPQAAALASALALGPPVPGDPLTVYAATLSLLAAAAEERPVLGVVDDLHWLDASSTAALLFVARRLRAEGIALLLAARPGGVRFPPELPRLELAGLDDRAATALLTRSVRRIDPRVAARLVTETGGNPLALLELPALLSEGQLEGREPLQRRLLVGERVERAFLDSAEVLPDETQLALLVAAASESGAVDEISGGLQALGIAVEAFEPAEAAGLVTHAGGEVRFRHPLARSAIYHGAGSGARRRVHGALAAGLAGPEHAARRAWHLAEATVGPDEEVASALERTALDARRRGGHTAAARAFARAAALTSAPEGQASRLLEAARDHQLTGDFSQAAGLLNRGLAMTDHPSTRADIQHLRARGEMANGHVMGAHALLLAEAERIETQDPARGAKMLAEAIFPCLMTLETQTALTTAERAHELAQRAGGQDELLLTSVFVAYVRVLRGGEPGAVLNLALETATVAGLDATVTPFLHTQSHLFMLSEQYSEACRVLEAFIAAARAAGAPAMLPFALSTLAEVEYRIGRWAASRAHASESATLATDTGQPVWLTHSLANLARVDAAQGNDADCSRHLDRAVDLATAVGNNALLMQAGSVRALLALARGANEAVIAELEPVAELARRGCVREAGVVQWEPDLIEAYARAGRPQDAEHLLADFEDRARAKELAWALAASARCRGLTAPDDDFKECFAQALTWHERTPTPFERARTRLGFGERLRRTGHRIEAREQLRAALTAFEQLGARPWRERAAAELAASGETAQRRDTTAAEKLTPQELQVALAVAHGATNREAASALFLSPKTIEFHLGHAYRKLDVRSRSQLTRLLTERELDRSGSVGTR